MDKKIILGVLFMLFGWGAFAQNQFNMTQYMIHQPIVNMAAIGSYDNLNGALYHRQQWVGFKGAPTTSLLTLNAPIKGKNFHVGGLVMQDNIGANQNTSANLGFAYRMKVSEKNHLALSLKGGINHMVSDYSGLFLNDVDDPEFPNASVSTLEPDFGFGSYFFSEKYYVGFAVPSLLRSANLYSTSELVLVEDFHYFLHGGYQFDLNQDFKLGLSTLLKAVLGSPFQYDVNAQVFFKDLVGLGVSYRSSNDICGILTLNIHESFMLSYSYDFGLSELATFHSNTHEVMLIYKRPSRDLLRISSPRF
jgi:type IX secretion system PorP/SprF family membrane protein